jgi:exopolysaccharide biosynthesis polyprenyl glycosylphosphotransferase
MFVGQIGWRIVARVVYRFSNPIQPHKRNVLLLGNPSSILDLQELIQDQTESKVSTFTYPDQESPKNLKSDQDYAESILDYAIKEQISDVILASFDENESLLNTIVSNLHRSALRVWIVPDYYHLAIHHSNNDNLSGLFLFELKAPTLSEKQRLVKRAFDLAISLVLLLPGAFLMGFISLAIRLETQGCVVFRQKRVGENGRLFGMYKFRTMVANAEELKHLVEQEDENGIILHKKNDDPRVTKIGKFLRRTSLDELPQLFNVIKGEMSLVGPRPELPHLVDRYQNWQRQRFTVPQGMTGWWQINGRSDRPMHLNTEDDIYYVQNYSIWLDFYILYKTIGVVISGKGAF